MWSRKDVKQRGKERFKLNYWKSVLVALILAVVLGSSGGTAGGSAGSVGSRITYNANETSESTGNDDVDEIINDITSTDPNADVEQDINTLPSIIGEIETDSDGNVTESIPAGAIVVFTVVMIIVALVIIAIAFVFDAFIVNPFELGCRRFFFKNLDEESGLSSVVYAFDHNYLNIVKAMFVRELQICLWSLLFVIPGIVVSYSLRMVPYILAENPEMDRKEAFELSKSLMKGNKWRAFVVDLSFIGWELLSVLTCGILSVFYVEPYKASTHAALYEAIRYGAVEE